MIVQDNIPDVSETLEHDLIDYLAKRRKDFESRHPDIPPPAVTLTITLSPDDVLKTRTDISAVDQEAGE